MTLTTRGEATAIHRALDERRNGGPVFGLIDSLAAFTILSFLGDERFLPMAENIVNRLGEAGCIGEVYYVIREGADAMEVASSPYYHILYRNAAPTDAEKIEGEPVILATNQPRY